MMSFVIIRLDIWGVIITAISTTTVINEQTLSLLVFISGNFLNIPEADKLPAINGAEHKAVTRRIKLRHLVQNYFAYFSPITKQDRAASMISFVIVVMQLTFMILVACLITLSTNLKLPFVILKIVDITS